MIKVAEMRATFEHVAQQVSATFEVKASFKHFAVPEALDAAFIDIEGLFQF